MNEIERAVVLSTGAKPLDAYGRNYAWDGQGKVVATYLEPLSPPDRSIGCDVMLENFASRPCTEKETAESTASEARSIATETRAGQRRWFSDPRKLPSISDGGCMQVNEEYDTATHRVLTVACNGEA